MYCCTLKASKLRVRRVTNESVRAPPPHPPPIFIYLLFYFVQRFVWLPPYLLEPLLLLLHLFLFIYYFILYKGSCGSPLICKSPSSCPICGTTRSSGVSICTFVLVKQVNRVCSSKKTIRLLPGTTRSSGVSICTFVLVKQGN